MNENELQRMQVEVRRAHGIFGSPDDLMPRSWTTLRRQVDGAPGVSARALGVSFGGRPEPAAPDRLASPR